MESKVCPWCQSPFETELQTKIYCTWTCKEKAKKLRNKKRYPENARKYNKSWRDRLTLEEKRKRRKAGELRAIGWSPEKIKTTAEQQEDKCAICGEIPPPTSPTGGTGGLVPDHKHTDPPLPRGLLCHNCNAGLGFFNETIERLESAILYLKRFSA